MTSKSNPDHCTTLYSRDELIEMDFGYVSLADASIEEIVSELRRRYEAVIVSVSDANKAVPQPEVWGTPTGVAVSFNKALNGWYEDLVFQGVGEDSAEYILKSFLSNQLSGWSQFYPPLYVRLPVRVLTHPGNN